MLVLSRKAGEKILIGDGITVVVNRVAGGRVTLAIDAPNSVRILRGELEAFADGRPAATSPSGATLPGAALPGTMAKACGTGPLTAALPPALARRAQLPPLARTAVSSLPTAPR
jgi:carbon storage regulator